MARKIKTKVKRLSGVPRKWQKPSAGLPTRQRRRAIETAFRETPRQAGPKRETKEARKDRLYNRRQKQLSDRSGTRTPQLAIGRKQLAALRTRFLSGQVAYRPHQGQREMARRQRQAGTP